MFISRYHSPLETNNTLIAFNLWKFCFYCYFVMLRREEQIILLGSLKISVACHLCYLFRHWLCMSIEFKRVLLWKDSLQEFPSTSLEEFIFLTLWCIKESKDIHLHASFCLPSLPPTNKKNIIDSVYSDFFFLSFFSYIFIR